MAGAVRSVGDFRAALGADADRYSDEELLGAMAAATGHDLPTAAEKFGYDTDKGPWHEKASSSVDKYQSSLSGLGEAVSSKLGLESASAFFGRRRRANDISAGISGQRAVEGGIPDDWRNIDGVGSAGRYVGGLAFDSGPYIGEAAIGGPVGRGVRLLAGGVRASELAVGSAEAAQAIAASRRAAVGGAVAASYPSSVADVLGNQREQNGETNVGAALALGVPYAALNAFNPLERAAAKTSLPRVVSPVLDNVNGIRGRVARAGVAGIETAIGEGSSEVGQEFMNQLGRMSVDEQATFWNEDSKKRYVDSFVGGAALGGVAGGGLSGGRRSEHYRGAQSPLDSRSAPETTEPTAPVQDLMAPAPKPLLQIGYDPNVSNAIDPVADNTPMQGFPNGQVAATEQDAFDQRMAPQPASVHLMTAESTEAGQSDTQLPNVPAASTTAPAMGYEPPPIPTPAPEGEQAGSQTAPAPEAAPPVQHSGTPEAIARIEETRARKVAATDAIARAQEAGMSSEKQQTLFWRAEELAAEKKIPESKMTQVTALLLQSKFGQVKTMLDEAAAGQPDAEGQAVVKSVTRSLDQIDKEIHKEKVEQAKLIDGAKTEPMPTVAKTMRAAAKDKNKRIASLEAERVEVVKHGAEKAGVTQPVTATPASAEATPAPTPTPAAVAQPAPVTPAAAAPTIGAPKLKAAAEKANKIRRLESLLACLMR